MEEKICLEAVLLNTILSYEEAFMEFAGINFVPEAFDQPEHRIILKDALEYFYEKGKAPGFAGIYEMQLVSKENRHCIKEYLKKVISASETSVLEVRNLARKITEMKAEAELREYKALAGETGLEYLQSVNGRILDLTLKYLTGMSRVSTNLEVADAVVTRIMYNRQNNFIKTGIKMLDSYTNGIPRGHMTVIAGRPGTGKTTFMLQLFRNFMQMNLKPAIFSIEMTAESLMLKNLSAISEVDSLKLESGSLTDDEKKKVVLASRQLTLDNYKVVDLSVQTPETIRAQINLWKVRGEADIILLDYLTLVKTDYRQPRQDLEIGKLSAELNAAAKASGLPVVVLSQLNRQSEARNNKRPLLSDLRESGTIEQDASLVLLLHRPVLYDIDPMKEKGITYKTLSGAPLNKDEYFEVIVAKARSGRTGKVCLRYRPEIQLFEEVIIEHAGEGLAEEKDPDELGDLPF